MTNKISSNQIDQSPYMYLRVANKDLDPLSYRIATGYLPLMVKIAKTSGVGGGNDGNGDGGDDGSVDSSMIPSLGDISIKGEQSVDYTTVPPTIKLTIQGRNSTGEIVNGMNIRRTL